MAPSSSPYSIFKADDWMISVAPNDTADYVNCRSRMSYEVNALAKKRNVTISIKEFSVNHVQLAFA